MKFDIKQTNRNISNTMDMSNKLEVPRYISLGILLSPCTILWYLCFRIEFVIMNIDTVYWSEENNKILHYQRFRDFWRSAPVYNQPWTIISHLYLLPPHLFYFDIIIILMDTLYFKRRWIQITLHSMKLITFVHIISLIRTEWNLSS